MDGQPTGFEDWDTEALKLKAKSNGKLLADMDSIREASRMIAFELQRRILRAPDPELRLFDQPEPIKTVNVKNIDDEDNPPVYTDIEPGIDGYFPPFGGGGLSPYEH